MRFQIDPVEGESQRGCSAILRAALPPSHDFLVFLGLYAAVGFAAAFFTPSTTWTTGAIGALAVAATVVALQLQLRSRLRHLRANDPHNLETQFLELTPDGVHAGCAHVDMRYPWADFAKVMDSAEFYLFVRPSGTGCALPKRLLSAADDSALRACIREWAKDRGTHLSSEAG